MADPDPDSSPDASPSWAQARWRKSSHSPDGGTNCLEWTAVDDRVGVRDSTDPAGGVLVFGRRAWTDFVAGVKLGEFDA
jgi:hypothetical protein